MPRLHRYLVPALLLLPLILVCGKLLLTPVTTSQKLPVNKSLELIFGGYRHHSTIEARGWPWIVSQTIDTGGDPLVDAKVQPSYFSWVAFIADVTVMAAFISAAAAILVRHRRRRGSWLRFSIREMFVIVTLTAACLGYYVHNQTRSRTERQILRLFSILQPAYGGPDWLLRLWPTNEPTLFHRVVGVNIVPNDLPADQIEQLLVALRGMPSMHNLSMGIGGQYFDSWPTDDQLRDAGLPNEGATSTAVNNLEKFELVDVREPDAPTIQSIRRFPGLRSLELDHCKLSDDLLVTMGRLDLLEELELQHCEPFDDASITRLIALPRLRKLDLRGTDITEAAIDQLKKFPVLDELRISGHNFTDLGLRGLAELPQLKYLTVQRPWEKTTAATLELLKRRKIEVSIY